MALILLKYDEVVTAQNHMYLRFTPIAPFPLASAVLTFSFVDLDLKNVNDPNGFTETLQFFSATNSALTSMI
ncbi:MAG TPA: hypothetical protein VJV04_07300, partial [Nitrospiraceae bacterium]|nr:hypothetical protein [Nitrospiraceae bacterium]